MVAQVLASILLSQGMPTPAQIKSASEYNASVRGISFLIIQRGKTLAEEYPNGGSATNATELASGTKSFTGVMALCAQEDGLLTLDEKASKTLPEWRGDTRKDITIRDLLTLSSGIPGNKGTRMGQRVPSYKDAITTEAVQTPGRKFQYGPTPFMCFGEILRRKLEPRKESVLSYIERRILNPIGAKHGNWRKDSDGNPHLPSGAFFSAREWSKFGEMILNDGKGVLKPGQTKALFEATKANPSYGLSWWLPAEGGVRPDGFRKWNFNKNLPRDIHIAAGAGGQRLYVIPSVGLVVVRQAKIKLQDDFDDSTFLSKLLLG
ncbi:MAG: beta-lactamase family protein [Chlorobia bacterium]|nr:beta-lactamase family protein [Fimbriimonadaceae bacterium]